MKLNAKEQSMLAGESGFATRKAMEILVALGTIYDAERMVPVTSVQISGVSYDNLGEAGLQFVDEMARGGGKTQVLTTLNPAGMDIENWKALGISPDFANHQLQVIDAFSRMGVITSCTCTPYLSGNLPHFGEHIAWAESSAVCFANSVLGARTNREGGPSALAASLTGVTPEYGYHLDNNRVPSLTFEINTDISETYRFGALGMVIGRYIETSEKKHVPFIRNIKKASLEELKSFCASIATFGGTSLFHMEGITPETSQYSPPANRIPVSEDDIQNALAEFIQDNSNPVDFVSLGCPHLSIKEISQIAEILQGEKVTKTFWITTSRTTKKIADDMGYSRIIEDSGAVFAVDTCCVVAPIQGRFKTLVTDSAKACYYATSKNHFKAIIKPFESVVREAL